MMEQPPGTVNDTHRRLIQQNILRRQLTGQDDQQMDEEQVADCGLMVGVDVQNINSAREQRAEGIPEGLLQQPSCGGLVRRF